MPLVRRKSKVQTTLCVQTQLWFQLSSLKSAVQKIQLQDTKPGQARAFLKGEIPFKTSLGGGRESVFYANQSKKGHNKMIIMTEKNGLCK